MEEIIIKVYKSNDGKVWESLDDCIKRDKILEW